MAKYTTLLYLSVLLGMFSCRERPETHTVEARPLREAVYASGEILPFEYEYLTSSGPERIHRILVQEGDIVDAGQVLVILGTPSENERLGILSNQLALARENASETSAVVAELEERIALAQKQHEQDSLDARRYAELAVTQAVSRKQADDAAIRAQASRTSYNNLRQQLRSLRNELQSNVLTAENQLAQYQGGRESRVLVSRVGGRVFSVHREPGETVNANESILLVGTPNRFRLVLLVDERDIARIKIGQEVLFETDAYAGQQFRGKVNKIVPVLQRENRSFEIEAEVVDGEAFFPQSSVEANVIVRDSSSVLTIPTSYLLPGDSVWLKSESGAERKVPVQSGIRDGQFVEIRNGLQQGDVVINKQPAR